MNHSYSLLPGWSSSLVVAFLLIAHSDRCNAQTSVNVGETADAFVSSANPTSNYGGAGALSISGSTAVNGSAQQEGLYDSYMRFNTASAISTFNSTYGVGNWTITSVQMKLTEVAAPNNAIFNRGVGQFSVQWISNDSWVEGTGTPSAPTTNGVTWNDTPGILSSGQDISLGSFSNAGTNSLQTFSLALNGSFLSNLEAGGDVNFYDTALSSSIGFTFDGLKFASGADRPILDITANVVPEPSTLGLLMLGSCAGLMFLRRRSALPKVALSRG